MRALMVQGCTSWAGKSLLTTVLCRWASDLGIDVAPFKAQNMANNARVTPDGEIGVAQWLQARAARVEPHVDHNPVLLKPEADTRSQVVVHGEVDDELTGMPWLERPPRLWDAIEESGPQSSSQMGMQNRETRFWASLLVLTGFGLFFLSEAVYLFWYSSGQYLSNEIRISYILQGSMWLTGFVICSVLVSRHLKYRSREP